MAKAIPTKHIGIIYALCDRRKSASLREDLGVERYKQLGVKERHVGQEPYRICPKCIRCVGDSRWMAYEKNKARRRPPSTRTDAK